MPEFYMILARKINKIPEFYMILPKMPEFYIIIARQIFSRFFWGGGRAPSAPYPTPMFTIHLGWFHFSQGVFRGSLRLVLPWR